MASGSAVLLANTNVRDGVFQAMGAAGLKASITVPAFTNRAQESNFFQTLQSMSRAGLFTTNAPKPPNPYE